MLVYLDDTICSTCKQRVSWWWSRGLEAVVRCQEKRKGALSIQSLDSALSIHSTYIWKPA